MVTSMIEMLMTQMALWSNNFRNITITSSGIRLLQLTISKVYKPSYIIAT